MKPPLTYYGGKQTLAGTIKALIPKHALYCEPFFGGGAVFFSKLPSEMEVINDTNQDLINFYKIAKSNFSSLSKEIACTLHGREYHRTASVILAHPHLFNDVKRAWAIWVLANQSYASKLDGPWGYDKARNTSAKRLHNKRVAFTKHYAKRLEKTEIESADALYVIKSRDTKDSFFYCDPPYFNSNMGHYKGYSKDDFEKLLVLLSKIKGKFLLSSYPSPLLSKYIKANKWHCKKMDMPLVVSARLDAKKRKVEVLTANYPI